MSSTVCELGEVGTLNQRVVPCPQPYVNPYSGAIPYFHNLVVTLTDRVGALKETLVPCLQPYVH